VQRESGPVPNRSSTESVGVYIPPHRNGASSEHRYSKDQLLSLFRSEHETGNLNANLTGVYVNGWEPNLVNGASTSAWGRRDEQKEHQVGADICWDREGATLPLGLSPLSAEEKEVRMHSQLKTTANVSPQDILWLGQLTNKTSHSAKRQGWNAEGCHAKAFSIGDTE
jgi:hypothetical protein